MVEEDDEVHARQRVGEPLRVSVSSRLTRSTTVIEPTPGAGADATSRNVDGDAFGAERRVRGFVPKLARSRSPQRDRPSRIEVLVARENALALAVTKNHTASFEERLKASSMIRR